MSGVFFVNPFHCLEVQDQFEESNGLLSICLCLREAVERVNTNLLCCIIGPVCLKEWKADHRHNRRLLRMGK